MSLVFHKLLVSKIVEETADTYSVFLEKPREDFDYFPGQYTVVKLEVNGQCFRRTFSFSSSPVLDTHLCLTIKKIPGGKVSGALQSKIQDQKFLELSIPQGDFVVELRPDQRKRYVLFGAGSGVTPLYSILRSILAVESGSQVIFVDVNRNEESIIFYSSLKETSEKYREQLQLIHVLSNPSSSWQGLQGRLEGKLLQDVLAKILEPRGSAPIFYLCGPEDFMKTISSALKERGVSPSSIRREYFSAPTSEASALEQVERKISQPEKVHIRLDKKAYELLVKPEQSILEAALEAKLDPPYACLDGICSTCRAKLQRGSVCMDHHEGLSEKELQAGYVLTCQARPTSSDVLVEFD